jgi:hypothetical protein
LNNRTSGPSFARRNQKDSFELYLFAEKKELDKLPAAKDEENSKGGHETQGAQPGDQSKHRVKESENGYLKVAT